MILGIYPSQIPWLEESINLRIYDSEASGTSALCSHESQRCVCFSQLSHGWVYMERVEVV